MTRDRQDANKKQLVDFWRRAGGLFYTQPRENGFDGVAVYRGHVYIVEIKDGSKPKSAQALTENEQEQRAKIEARGVEYHIWRSLDDVVALLEAGVKEVS